ncbi:MAG TPA: glycoside hydrolase family 3 C-terminal domain-containing protein [Candidatus Didemnitutus sp.]|nr:glycoside hydrolase family 3 C-terminal domain-containing protein [Candidatus Didemnitutus sp.]
MSLPRFGASLALALLFPMMSAGESRPAYLDPTLPVESRVDDLLPRLTLEEKISLVHANSKFSAGGIARLGLPALWMADGPQGVREEIGPDTWEPAGRTDDFATAMPVPIALASTWDSSLAEAYGKVIGEEARARHKDVMLAPGLNIMRTPLCGRNYDYFGEDPWLAGRMTVGYVHGMQGENVIACIKHFAANNQETHRGTIDVEMDERTLREIYLPAFEAGIREGGAMAIMGAYNKFRGEHCCHNDYLLNQVLKKDWGFAGAVISDWGGTHDTREAVVNGLDIEMGTGKPYDDYFLARPFREGVANGTYPMAVLDDKVRRHLRLLFATGAVDGRRPGSINTKAHLDVARKIATEGIVLLKNSENILPLDPTKVTTIAVIGENAIRTFAAGGNSAGVKAFREITVLEGIVARAGKQADIRYSQGYNQPARRWVKPADLAGVRASELSSGSTAEAQALADRAVRAAKEADVVIFVAGLTHQSLADDEGVDRMDLALPSGQADLIRRVVAANPRTIVTLVSGSPIEMDSWLGQVPAVVQAWYGGSEAGPALASVLFGDANPSGKLPCTFPHKISDSPAHASGSVRQFPGENGVEHYDEGLLVGYRWYDAKKIEPLFPFGFGLSYTHFDYANLKVTPGDGATATVECEITNSGEREGSEVVQVYVQPGKSSVDRPERELKGFARVDLKPGEKKSVTIPLTQRSFAYYSPEQHGWVAEAGDYVVRVGASSRDLRLEGKVALAASSTTH